MRWLGVSNNLWKERDDITEQGRGRLKILGVGWKA